jgi:hypothetical protein
MRRTRPLIALAAAYGLVLAALFGALAAGQAAAFGAIAFCRVSDLPGDQTPARHDLDCCLGCNNASMMPVPATAAAPVPAFTRLVWPANAQGLFRVPVDGGPSARAPPVRL